MIKKQLTFQDLAIPLSEVYEAMGYTSQATPDPAVEEETQKLLEKISATTRPSFLFFITHGELDIAGGALTVNNTTFHIGKIIARQLKGSECFAFFVATAGSDFEQFQQELQQEDDLVKTYITDAIGSIIAEKTADRMETSLEEHLSEKNRLHTNRFSPGYCGWHVSEQRALFSLFPTPCPCGIHLTDSSLMLPIKSVSGIIGIGSAVHKLEYSCGLCTYEKCYRRKKKNNG
ncbi:vitamin B12 dependent-methionine synthase activation domain-containing protein [Bacteroides sp.]